MDKAQKFLRRAERKKRSRDFNNQFHSLMDKFWHRFRQMTTRDQRLALLKGYSVIQIAHNEKPYERRRREKLHFRLYGDCAVCDRQAAHRHHIIALKNGGPNKTKNLIRLCEGCHCEIHPWLEPTLPKEMAETMERVEREV